MTTLTPQVHADLIAALGVANLPDVHWLQGDDLCDCTFQRVGQWTNPYLAKTLRVRLCCIWNELYKAYPQFVQDIDAAYDLNRHEWVTEPQEWDSEDMDMPLPLWYRQVAQRDRRSLAEVRLSANRDERPRAKARTTPAVEPTSAEVESAQLARLRLTGWL
jgi:hypothetical protein